ncbi:LysR family transcriptional regulator [Microbacterium sp.]|uniref:LysR family transcriptional regulator n=1 Tax=Microbacterium sp. TaxID=51671 RepID=UPI003F727A7E
MVELRVLKTFIAVIDSGSVVAAARERGYSPAAVSRQIAWLQRRLEVRFFEPDGRSIRPTPDALEFASRARELVDEVDRFERYSNRFSESRARQRA